MYLVFTTNWGHKNCETKQCETKQVGKPKFKEEVAKTARVQVLRAVGGMCTVNDCHQMTFLAARKSARILIMNLRHRHGLPLTRPAVLLREGRPDTRERRKSTLQVCFLYTYQHSKFQWSSLQIGQDSAIYILDIILA